VDKNKNKIVEVIKSSKLKVIILCIIGVYFLGVLFIYLRPRPQHPTGLILGGEDEAFDKYLQEKSEKEKQEQQKPKPGSMGGRLIGDGCYNRTMKDGQFDEYHFRIDFNNDPANTSVHYENKEAGIAFDVPYNKNWGNKDCQVLPYVQIGDQTISNLLVDFGSAHAFIGPAYHFRIRPKRTANDIINEQKGVGGEPNPNPRLEKIGPYTVVVYESYGMGDSRIYEVVGKTANYKFSTSPIDVQKNPSSPELERVIKSLKYIKD